MGVGRGVSCVVYSCIGVVFDGIVACCGVTIQVLGDVEVDFSSMRLLLSTPRLWKASRLTVSQNMTARQNS